MSAFELTATARADVGKGASRRLRRNAEKIPAIIYGAGQDPLSLTLSHFEVSKALKNEAFYSHILTLNVDGKKQQAVLKAIQRHPYKPFIQHMDFMRITGKEKIRMHVPLHFTGEEQAPGVKDDQGIVSHLLTGVDIFCLPKDLPEYISVDLSQLKLDESIHLSHLKLPAGVELVDLSHGHHDDKAVASIHIPRAVIEEEETTAPVASEVPAINQTAEPEAPAAEDGKDKK